MKKMISVFGAATLAASLILTGCANSTETAEPAEEKTEETTGSGAVLGGWEAYTDYAQLIAEDEKTYFEEATEKLLGVNYTPVQMLAKQVVSGTNYAYLAATETVTKDPVKGFAIVTVYVNLEGKAEVTNVAEIDINDIKVKDNIDDAKLGGWTVEDIGKVAGISEDGEAAFSKAIEGFTGVGLKPIVLLATQTVSGKNYKFLCRGTTVTADPVTSLYVTTVYQDTEGKCTITENQVFDLTAYVTPAE